MSLVDQIMMSRRMALSVKRYHSWPTIQTQTVADHTCQVMRVYYEIFGRPLVDIYEYILFHDITEMWTGDIPFPLKSKYPALGAAVKDAERDACDRMGIPDVHLDDDQKKRVKICDLAEMWEFGRTELLLGNKLANPIVERTNWALSLLAEEAGVTADISKWQEGHL